MTTLPQSGPVRTTRALPTTQLALPGSHAPGLASALPASSALTGADVWRVLRANIWLISSIFLFSCVAGYGVNSWLALKHSRYTSTGLLKVRMASEQGVEGEPGGVNTAELEVEQTTQVNLLTHERLIASILESSEAIRQTDWFKQFIYYRNGEQKVDAEAAKADLLEHLDVAPIPQSRLIRVKMSWSIPKDCQTIVREVVDQHIKNQKDIMSTAQVELTNMLEQLKLNYEGQSRDINGRMSRIATDLGDKGVGLTPGANSKAFELQSLIGEQLRAMAFLGASEAKQQTFEKQMETNSAPELEEATQRSPLYAEQRRQVDDLQLAYADTASRLGTNHPTTISLKRRLDAAQAKLSDTENDIKSRTAELLRANLANDRLAAHSALTRINERIDSLRKEIAEYSKMLNEYDHLTKELAYVRENLEKVKEQQDKIGYLGHANWSQVDWATLPDLPDHPTFPKMYVTMPLAIMVGLAFSLGIAFLREVTDNTVRTPRDLVRIGQLTLLGMIPHEDDDPQAAGARLPLAIFEAPQSIIAEQFRQLRTRLQHAAALDTTRSLLVTGCTAGDGVTSITVNLAAGLALNGRRILLVDANFRRPGLQEIFQTSSETGFGDVLNDLERFHEAVHETEVPNLSVILAGRKPSNPTELLESQLLVDFIEKALETYDHVIFDTGPLLMVSDTIALAPRVDGVVTVVRARGSSRGMMSRMRDELRRLKAEHLGVVLNAVRVHTGGYYGMMIKNYYAYQNE